MKTLLLTLAATLAALPSAYSQSTPGGLSLPCSLSDYRITSDHTMVVRCDRPVSKSIPAIITLYKVLDESVVFPGHSITSELTAGTEGFWLSITLPETLVKGQDYEVRIQGSNSHDGSRAATNYLPARLRFTTRATLNVIKNPGQNGVRLSSNLPIETGGAGALIDHSHAGTRYSLTPRNKEAAFSGGPEEFGQLLFESNIAPGDLGQKLEVVGVKDSIFGQVPSVKAAKPTPAGTAPKNKDSAIVYLNVLHQAGVGLPLWIAYGKLTPVLGVLPGGFLLTPTLDLDIGSGQIGTNKTNDIFNPKFGVTRQLRSNSAVEATSFTGSLSFQSNRAFTKNSLLFDEETQIFLRGLRNAQSDRSLDAYFKKRETDSQITKDEVRKAIFGYKVQVFAGTEAGSSLTDNTVKSSDKSSSVVVPKYSIIRFRPRAVATFEIGKFTVSLNATPRWLSAREFVTREADVSSGGKTKKDIYLSTVSGWRGYGELSISYAFDAAGHYGISTVYKSGSQPPNFDRVNIVQSGLLIKF